MVAIFPAALAASTLLALASPASLKARAEAHVASLPPSRVKVMLAEALSYLGTPYRWGGDNPEVDGGFDCVGFAYRAYHDSGLEFPLPRFSSLNMTPAPRDPQVIPKLWWTEYFPDFEATMRSCKGGPFADGDVLVYHVVEGGKITDRTGHVLLVVDSSAGLAVSAASGGVKLHSLGDFSDYDGKSITACWRAPSASKPPYTRPKLTWSIALPKGEGTHASPYITTNPLDVEVSISGPPELNSWKVDVAGRVLSFIGFVSPKVDELPANPGIRHWHIHHDFKATDLPVDPGEKIPTPQRRLVIRLLDGDGFVKGEKDFFVQFKPYWN